MTGFAMDYRLTSLVCFCLVAWPDYLPAQTQSLPDLSGPWTRKWETASLYDSPKSGPGPVVMDPARPHHGHIVGVNGQPDQEATPWIADYSNPILKPEARAVVKRISDEESAGHSHIENQTVCKPMGVPEILNLRDHMQMLQAPSGKEITLIYSRDSQVRHVYMNVEHSKNPPKTWYGESVGHVEGDTLVIDTIGLNDKTETDRFGTPHSDQIHVVERYRLSDDKKTLEVRFAVEDPKFFTTIWSGIADYRRDGRPVLETICAENPTSSESGSAPAIPIALKSDF
jgi:hypothetical protein